LKEIFIPTTKNLFIYLGPYHCTPFLDPPMASRKPGGEILEDVVAVDSDTSSKDSAKATDTGTRPEEDDIETSPANSTQHRPAPPGKRQELTSVASEISRHRTNTASGAEGTLSKQESFAGFDNGDPALDPASPEFDAYKWANRILLAADKASVKFRRASFAFKNLDVLGSESGSNFQGTVASIFMIPFRLHEYVSLGKQPEKKILSSFDGVTKSGEMLLVLGRPGSGCSTFLKTITGELSGLKIGKSSVVYYNGNVSQTSVFSESMLTSIKAFLRRR
jgi:ATP-binding cassette, subfamily G (WHITE), member 2, PDR